MGDAQVQFDQSTVLLMAEMVSKLHVLDARVTALEEDVAGLLEDAPENDGDDGSRDAYE